MNENFAEDPDYPKVGSWVVRANVPVDLRLKWGGYVTAVFEETVVTTREETLEAFPKSALATEREIWFKAPSPALLTNPQERMLSRRKSDLPYDVGVAREAAKVMVLMGQINECGDAL